MLLYLQVCLLVAVICNLRVSTVALPLYPRTFSERYVPPRTARPAPPSCLTSTVDRVLLTAQLGPRFSHLLCLLMVILLFKCLPRTVLMCH